MDLCQNRLFLERHHGIHKMIKPIFIFSLPRTGSTLLQKILSSHPQISTTPETWVLLNLLSFLNEGGVVAEYSHQTASKALLDTINDLPKGKTDYFSILKETVYALYEKLASADSLYFLDKTPRYHLIVDSIQEIFQEEGKYIVLWRHPLAVVASMLSFRPPWNLYDWYIDLYKGFNNLFAFSQKQKASILSLNYESLVKNPTGTLEKVCDFLEIEHLPKELVITQTLIPDNRMGDHTKEYASISTATLHKWKQILNNPVRIWWARRYLDYLGKKRLSQLGYNIDKIKKDLSSITPSYKNIGIDIAKIFYGYFHTVLSFTSLRARLRALKSGERIYPFS